jgi:cytidylate kinase
MSDVRPTHHQPARLTIAIDGPAGSGKSTLGAALARRLGYTYFDTGVMYRAVTWLALQRGLDVGDGAGLARLARDAKIEVHPASVEDGRQYTVLADGEDVTWHIRTPEVDRHVSAVSAHPGVRAALVDRQRELAAGGGMVMVGRDIGTVVLPEADLKLYLTASSEERARRRTRELEARGQTASYDAILADMRRRDALDSGRAAAPLRPAPDAVDVDGDRLTVEDEVALAVDLLERRAPGCTSSEVPGDNDENGDPAGEAGVAAHGRWEP